MKNHNSYPENIAFLTDKFQAIIIKLRNRLCQKLEYIENEFAKNNGKNDPRLKNFINIKDDQLLPENNFFKKSLWEKENNIIKENRFSGEIALPQNGGITSILQGNYLEKAGVHISNVHGKFSTDFAKQIPGANIDPSYHACGLSVIIHPFNPHAPSAHMNIRFINTQQSWVGGGCDLNPLLPQYRTQDHVDTLEFLEACKVVCEKNNVDYEKFKKQCDDYFTISHRNEKRGIGGIFFDKLNSGNWQKDFKFCQNVGEVFIEIYGNLLCKHVNSSFTHAEQLQQFKQRGRYVEFNLLYDRGTKFGLMTGGNVNSILSSMPPFASW